MNAVPAADHENKVVERRGLLRPAPSTEAPIESHRTRSLYRLTQAADGRIYATSGGAFPLAGYSLFKHGDERWARRFGHEIAGFLMDTETALFDLIRSNELLIASVPYKYVPTAAALMVNHTVARLNHALSGENKPAVGYLNAFKYPWQASGEHYFAHMGEEARRRILDNVELSVDENRLRGAQLIVVGDIRVTGQPRTSSCSCYTGSRGSPTVVYLCDVDPAVARTDPAIERRLNQHEVKNLDDVAAIAVSGEFRWNIRVAKFVLEQRNIEDFGAFLRGLEDGLLRALYHSVSSNDYHFEQKYRRRIRIIRSAVEARRLV
jgi:hypothetical protein